MCSSHRCPKAKSDESKSYKLFHHIIKKVIVSRDVVFKQGKSMKWKKAMNMEMQTIKKNDTWELVDPPKRVTPIRVKWIFNTKFNESGNIKKIIRPN